MNAVDLGATLYTPALNPATRHNAYGAIPNLRSMTVCLEDAIRRDEVEQAEGALAGLLAAFQVEGPTIHVFVRPRDIEMLARILRMPGADRIAGFVLPKVSSANIAGWLTVLVHENQQFMPTIEGEEAFDMEALALLRGQLRPYLQRVPAIRIGGNDLLHLFGARRSRFRTAYEGPLASAIRNITSAFVPSGFNVAAPVLEHYQDLDLLREEVERDIEHGLLTKTAVHPSQVEVIQRMYPPTMQEMTEARAIMDAQAPAVFGSSGSMCEPATHVRWAGNIIQRAQIYGIADHIGDAQSRAA